MRSVVKKLVPVMLLACLGSARAAIAAPDGSNASSDGLDSRRFTLWLGGPLELEYRPDKLGNVTFGIGYGATVVSTSSSSDSTSLSSLSGIKFSLIGDAYYFPKGNQSGLAFALSVGSANSVYFAPGIFYVSRPKNSICGRFGFLVPIGGGASPFLPEVAIGFRF